MKFNFELDCTPEEARAMIGLPDLRPLQQAVLARVEKQMLDAVSTVSPEGIVKVWLGAMPAASEQYVRAFTGLLRTASKRDGNEAT
ncbi:MAG: DUF6489 family protein [Vulcanimicrobiaceae bacterium]